MGKCIFTWDIFLIALCDFSSARPSPCSLGPFINRQSWIEFAKQNPWKCNLKAKHRSDCGQRYSKNKVLFDTNRYGSVRRYIWYLETRVLDSAALANKKVIKRPSQIRIGFHTFSSHIYSDQNVPRLGKERKSLISWHWGAFIFQSSLPKQDRGQWRGQTK